LNKFKGSQGYVREEEVKGDFDWRSDQGRVELDAGDWGKSAGEPLRII